VRRALLVVVVAATMAAAAGSAWADAGKGLTSKDQACAVQDPSCTAPVYGAPSSATYKGTTVAADDLKRVATTDAANTRGIVGCQQTPTRLICTDKAAPKPEAVARVKGKRTRAHRPNHVARAAHHYGCGAPENDGAGLTLYAFSNYSGDYVSLTYRQAWYTVPSFMNNRTTSFDMSQHSGHMSDSTDGSGYWYPGDTTACAHQQIYLYYPDWDNRVSARYRN
jgi:hypothetical protein